MQLSSIEETVKWMYFNVVLGAYLCNLDQSDSKWESCC